MLCRDQMKFAARKTDANKKQEQKMSTIISSSTTAVSVRRPVAMPGSLTLPADLLLILTLNPEMHTPVRPGFSI